MKSHVTAQPQETRNQVCHREALSLSPRSPECRVGAHIGRFEACSTFTGCYGLSARRVAKRPVCLEGSDGFVSSPRRFDSYRLERPSCRARVTLAEDQTPLHGAHLA